MEIKLDILRWETKWKILQMKTEWWRIFTSGMLQKPRDIDDSFEVQPSLKCQSFPILSLI